MNLILTILGVDDAGQIRPGSHVCVYEPLYFERCQTLSNSHTLEHKHTTVRGNKFTEMEVKERLIVHIVCSVSNMLTDPPQAQDTHCAVSQLMSTQPQSSPCAPATAVGKRYRKT